MATKFTLNDKWTYLLAGGVLIGFFFFFGVALFEGAVFSSPNDYSGIEKVAATIGLLPASIIGYYFGQRPVQGLTEQVTSVTSTRDQARVGIMESLNIVNNYEQEISRLRERIRIKDEIID